MKDVCEILCEPISRIGNNETDERHAKSYVNQSLAYGTMKQMKDVCEIICEPIFRIGNNKTDERHMRNHM